MAHSTSISLNEDQAEFVNQQVENGAFKSASEVVATGLRMLEEHAAKVKALEEALIEGEKGPFTPFDPDAFLSELQSKHMS